MSIYQNCTDYGTKVILDRIRDNSFRVCNMSKWLFRKNPLFYFPTYIAQYICNSNSYFLAIIAAVFNESSLMMYLIWLASRSRLIYRDYCNYLINQALCCVRDRDITSHVYKHKTCWFYLRKRALDTKMLFMNVWNSLSELLLLTS